MKRTIFQAISFIYFFSPEEVLSSNFPSSGDLIFCAVTEIQRIVGLVTDICFSQGGLPYKIDGGGRQKFSKEPLKGTRIVISGRGPN